MSDAITLNAEQDLAIGMALEYLEEGDGENHFTVSGLAGTGKTVTLIELVRRMKEQGFRPAVCAPTGKAAHVISGKQDYFKARTLHSVLTDNPVDHLKEINARMEVCKADMMARPHMRAELLAEWENLQDLADKYGNKSKMSFQAIDPEDFYEFFDCLICDEASMIGQDTMMRPFINNIKVPKIYFGDYGQLPPVQDRPAIDLANPDIKLTEIHRQAEGSGIIKVAHNVRGNGAVDIETFAASADLTYSDDEGIATVLEYAKDHQVLVWKNVTRHHLNLAIRLAKGFDYVSLPDGDQLRPMPGEELLFDQNKADDGIFKGQPLKIVEIQATDEYMKRTNPYLTKATIELENGLEYSCVLCLSDLIPPNVMLMDNQREDTYSRIESERKGVKVMYPYALTVHKSQGSEWPKVCVVGEYPRRMDGFPEWFYTGVTRAKDELVVLSKSYFKQPKKRRSMTEIRAQLAKQKA